MSDVIFKEEQSKVDITIKAFYGDSELNCSCSIDVIEDMKEFNIDWKEEVKTALRNELLAINDTKGH